MIDAGEPFGAIGPNTMNVFPKTFNNKCVLEGSKDRKWQSQMCHFSPLLPSTLISVVDPDVKVLEW